MDRQEKRSVRCAVYTRKSSEEGLEQSFNSLDAQREACLNYILSQRQEGWRAVETQYDDGGYSGGTMDRPGLKKLLADIDAGKVDAVVVYKVDRLTRSLADFAKIVEKFDSRGASFVSVTQQFSTTSSMGRLTLNVLLSFAQFEREVTGERIRDKISASKQKGMWMGGCIPLGYDLKDRHLIVNREEANRVREIYELYFKLGCVQKVKAHLDSSDVMSKVRVSRSGNASGGCSYSRGALYKILRSRTYLGEVPHRDKSYPGEHDAIIDRELWEKVRVRLSEGIRGRRHGRNVGAPSLLRGLLYDEHGNRFTPSHAVKSGKRYRYYVSQRVIEDKASGSDRPRRIPSQELEKAVLMELRTFLGSSDRVLSALANPSDDLPTTRLLIEASGRNAKNLDRNSPELISEFLAKVIARIVVCEDRLDIQVLRQLLRASLLDPGQPTAARASILGRVEDLLHLEVPATIERCRGELRLIIPPANRHSESGKPIPSLIKAIARAREWVRAIVAGEYKDQRAIAAAIGVNERYVSRVIASAFLSPRIVERIVLGNQSDNETLETLLEDVPLSWAAQDKRNAERHS